MTLADMNATISAAVAERQGPGEATGPCDATFAHDELSRRLSRQTNAGWMEGCRALLATLWRDRNAAWARVKELEADLAAARMPVQGGTTE